MPTFSRRTVLSCCAAAALTLSGCADVSGHNSSAPQPAKTLPTAIVNLVKTDVGQYFGTPKPGTSAKDIRATIDTLKSMPGVQTAKLQNDGRIDLEFLGGSTKAQREAAVRQLAAIGRVDEGI